MDPTLLAALAALVALVALAVAALLWGRDSRRPRDPRRDWW
jgi:nitrogen fixation-related uncharacterized protein